MGALDPLRRDSFLVVAAGIGAHRRGGESEQGATVGAENMLAQEPVEAVYELVLADEDCAPVGWPLGT